MANEEVIRLAHFEWKEAEPLHALICLPAMLLVMAAGILLDQPSWAAMAVGGAMCVGFGSFQAPIFYRYGPMLAAAVGITISTFLGAFFAVNTAALTLVCVVWAFLYGLTQSQGTAASWVGAQCCVYLIISSAAPDTHGRLLGTFPQAALRGVATLMGAILQFVAILFFWRFVPRIRANLTDPHFDPAKFRTRYLLEQLTPTSVHFHFAVRLAVTACITMLLYRVWWPFANGYWIAMTAVLVIKPEFYLTTERTILRLLGTYLGAGVATVIATLLRPNPWILAALVLAYLWACYVFMNVNYGIFSVAITGYIAFILAFNHLPEQAVLLNRILATTVGGAVALAIHAVFHVFRKRWPLPL
ncbi:FUSC family protein [Terriglobus tenax]|uniref:FUSC family protein n=1 Tax=Terriglobus tenax TaxID=1111115 RepID=UPI0021E0D879|nr:FUSC family protein [Terriglobus tenax]